MKWSCTWSQLTTIFALLFAVVLSRITSGIASAIATASDHHLEWFSGYNANIQNAQTTSRYATLDDWLDGPDTEINEEVIGLGECGRIWAPCGAISAFNEIHGFVVSRNSETVWMSSLTLRGN